MHIPIPVPQTRIARSISSRASASLTLIAIDGYGLGGRSASSLKSRIDESRSSPLCR
jgi:hypothetical protein